MRISREENKKEQASNRLVVDIDSRRLYLDQMLRRQSESSGACHVRNSPIAAKSFERADTRTKSQTPSAKDMRSKRLWPYQGGDNESGFVKIVMLKKKLHL